MNNATLTRELAFASVHTLGRRKPVETSQDFGGTTLTILLLMNFTTPQQHRIAASSITFNPSSYLAYGSRVSRQSKAVLSAYRAGSSDRPDKDRLAQRYELFKQQI